MQRDYSVGVLLKDLGKVLTVSYAHNIDPTSSVGAEVTKKLEEKEATVFALGCVSQGMDIYQGASYSTLWQCSDTCVASAASEAALKRLFKQHKVMSSLLLFTRLSCRPQLRLPGARRYAKRLDKQLFKLAE